MDKYGVLIAVCVGPEHSKALSKYKSTRVVLAFRAVSESQKASV